MLNVQNHPCPYSLTYKGKGHAHHQNSHLLVKKTAIKIDNITDTLIEYIEMLCFCLGSRKKEVESAL